MPQWVGGVFRVLFLVVLVGTFVFIEVIEGGFGGFGLKRQVVVEEPYGLGTHIEDDFSDFSHWVRPSGVTHVALQAGHWKKSEVPEEQINLRWNGAVVAGIREEDLTLLIAKEAKAIIEKSGVIVEILPTTIPPGYVADAFVAIHADKHADRQVSGYKVASPVDDISGAGLELARAVQEAYGVATDMQIEPNLSPGMSDYYAFNWRTYEHALHPMTPAMILETGYLSNAKDRRFIVNFSGRVAQGIASGVLDFLRRRGLVD